ncbi:MAG: HAMP domain-containing histidine kinase, partial [Kineothrix sp.]|nr:HAMP domain-containing histidine kinase [Kineothrix sp.]
LDENSILSFAFETAALNVPAKYDVLQDHTVEEIASNLETGGHSSSRLLRISDEQKNVLYVSNGFEADSILLEQTDESTKTYRIIKMGEGYYVQTGAAVDALDRIIYLETMRDISDVFEERELGFSVYRQVTVAMLIAGAVIMHLISSWLTKPIRLLTRATKRMAAGDYYYRAKQISNDELGQLTKDFNYMANALEENIAKLEEGIEDRENFVAAFAHELKTPLTAIIGYADMLRSHKLDEEKSFLSANYIYTEGKRLEAMSFRLLDIIVTKRNEVEFQKASAESIFLYLQDMFSGSSLQFQYRYDKGTVWAEMNLLKTVLVNLIDNACKASEAGGLIEVGGYRMEAGYRFEIKDYGVGIPEEEQKNIIKAFYMVDKSRARSKNGAGLGLALCEEILRLHGSGLK